MTILAIDDEPLALETLRRVLMELCPRDEIHCFHQASELLSFAETRHCELVFLDVQLGCVNGLELAAWLRAIQPDVNIIFVTGYAEYATEAFAVRASGYLLKPPTVESVREELRQLRYPPKPVIDKRLRVQCFGNFEVFSNDTLLSFRYSKTKELLAYLIDRRGAAISSGELLGTLWEDDVLTESRKNQLRNCKLDLSRILKSVDAEDVVVRLRHSCAVDVSKLDCDYFRFLQGDIAAVNTYRGEYMSQYTWAEMTLGALER